MLGDGGYMCIIVSMCPDFAQTVSSERSTFFNPSLGDPTRLTGR